MGLLKRIKERLFGKEVKAAPHRITDGSNIESNLKLVNKKSKND